MLYITIIEKLSLLVVLCVVSFFVNSKWNKEKLSGKILQGLLFGVITVLGMLDPLVISKGLIFDGRSILISLSGLFFGYITVLIAGTMAIIVRIFQGGVGSLTGVIVILSSVVIGIIGYIYRKQKQIKWNLPFLLVFSFFVHAVMLLSMFTLPYKTAVKVVRKLWVIILFIYPVMSVIIARVLYFQDIFKVYYSKIRESENRYKSLFKSSISGIAVHEIIYDEKNKPIGYKILDVNPAFENILNINRNDIINKRATLAYKTDKAPYLDEYYDVVKTKKPYFFETYFLPLNKYFEITVYSNFDNQFVTVFSDISKRVKAEKKLKEEMELVKKINETSPIGIAVLNLDGKIIFANKKAEEILGISKEIITDRFYNTPDWKITSVNGDVFPDEKLPFEVVRRTGESVYDVVHAVEFGNGKRKILSINAAPILNEDNEIISIVATLRDITQIKTMAKEREELIKKLKKTLESEKVSNEELEAANEEMTVVQDELEKTNIELEKALQKSREANYYKTEFLANMSHEIRTPLTAILGFNQLMMNDENLTDEQIEDMGLIHKSGQRLMRLLMDILEISKIEANKITIEKENIDLEVIYKDIIDLNSLKLKEKNIDFIYELNGIKEINTDPKRLSQILFNLIGNAIKFTNNGSIKSEVKDKNDKYLFTVSDTGIGIKNEIIDNIFDSFTVGEEGFTKYYDGTGLGLNICKRLVELLGGKIWVESKINHGSTFYFTIRKD